MSNTAPLVSEEGGAYQSANASDGDLYEKQPCGLKKYKKLTIFLVCAFFAAGFAIIIWSQVKRSGDHDDAHSNLPKWGLNQMFNSSLAPRSASLAWLGSESNNAATDQFISVINGSFFLTTLPAYDTPVMLINGADLDQFAPLTPPVQATSPASKAARRRLLARQDWFDAREGGMPDAASLHAPVADDAAASRMTAPATLRSMRPPSKRRMRAQRAVSDESESAPAAGVGATAKFIYQSYDLSPDQHAMLFGVNCLALYRHSSFCQYYLYDITAKTMTPLADGAKLRLATWSPTSGKIAFVLNDNVFIADLAAAAGTPPVQVTNDGEWNVVCNGIYDWAYEEEVASATSALWWAPDGDTIAFLRFNQSEVPLFDFSFYTAPYNEDFSYKYPKAGAPNSVVDVLAYSVSNKSLTRFPALREAFDYEYVMNVQWFDGSALMVRVENRAQNEWKLFSLSVDPTRAAVVPLSSATAPYYFEPHDCLTSLAPLPFYIDLVNSDSTAGTGTGDHVHLALYSSTDGAFVKFLTSGEFDVLTLDTVTIDVAAQTATVFYTREVLQTAANAAVPTLWRVGIDTTTSGADSVQLLPPAEGQLTMQSASYSPSGAYVLVQDRAVAPRSTLYAVNATQSLQSLAVLADNTPLVERLQSSFALPQTTFFEIDSTLPGLKLSASAMVPAGLDLNRCSGRRRRPVLIYAYGGPGSQQVDTAYKFGFASQGSFHASLVSSHDFIVVTVDPVGTKGKGEAYRKAHTYKRLGLQERDDMIAATRWIAKQCWADKSRISYWGWSYGGFMTSFVAAAGTNLYENLIAVAPVTSWTLYDSIYTERYMLRPQDNPDGYANTSVIAAASTNFDADAWHLFSGTADDNVHWQNSALLVDALINLDMPLSVFYFPNRAHSLTQWKTGAPPRYLYERLTRLLTGTGGPNGNGAMRK